MRKVECGSKSSKAGRFPPTAPAETRLEDIVGSGGDAVTDDARAAVGAVDAACRAWGADYEGIRERLGPRSRRAGATAETDDGSDERASAAAFVAPRVLLTHKNENLYNAYACEMAALSRGAARGVCVGMFVTPDGSGGETRVAAGLRAEIAPLCAAATAEELLERVKALKVCVKDSSEVAFVHDCVARHSRRMGTDALSAAFRDVVGAWGAGLAPRSKDERNARNVVRFAVVESAECYVFGLVTYAPSSLSLRAVDWARKPQHFSAGTRAEIALAAVNVATAHAAGSFSHENGDTVVVDPCCGSGTFLHAAWTRGFAAAGGDVSPGAVAMSRTNVGYFVGRAASGGGTIAMPPMPSIVERNALHGGVFADGYGSGRRVGAVVSNLPFGRRVAIGGGDGDGRGAPGASAEDYTPLLEAFRDVADRHVYISGVPIADEMRKLGYANVSDVSLCRFGRSFMTTALGSTTTTTDGALAPDVAFTTEEALANAAGKREKKWKKKEKSTIDVETRFANPDALRIAVDVSYEQDSTRARRSVAKQLCECVGVAHRNDNLAMTYCSWRGPIAEESREFFFSDRWTPVKKDERRVEDAFSSDEIVYMSPDAEDVLDIVESDKVYVIGGIVDLATRGMRTSLTRASKANMRCVRLPIKEFKPDQTHTVLNIDAVAKILVARREGLTWDEVFDRELPKRQAIERPKREKRERRAPP